MSIVVTGATGQLGRLVIKHLLARGVAPSKIIAAVRTPAKAADLGVEAREADYDKPETLRTAFAGAERVLVISSNDLGGNRAKQQIAAIQAAKEANVKQIVYTSILHADTTTLGLARDHQVTEAELARSGVNHVILRNGWYTENNLMGIPAALQFGVVLGAAGEGKFSWAARDDYALAAAVVLTQPINTAQNRVIYELAGDSGHTLAEFAAELSKATGRTIPYVNKTKEEYEAVLLQGGLPGPLAALLADSDHHAASNVLYNSSKQLSTLIGRPTTPLAESLKAAVAQQK
eukprot:comp14921_c0_seq1/m.22025 comp14921_c0_seq1/g.22025  ORF comp14921_c0_seq1/g.22025 comp14921_c0_seq1/m.22025 type:complete len:290 (-) comp14921_c0_seq1:12-881(-)